MDNKILVLGIGNVLLTDDGLGPLVIRELEQNYQNPQVSFLDGGTLGLDLLAYVEGYSSLLVIDALDVGEEPGTVFFWEGRTLDGISPQMSFHQVGVRELLHAVKLLDIDLQVALMGIQVADVSWGMELSPQVKQGVPLLKEKVIKYLHTKLFPC
ncbi:MAG: HyaD/HybD family hydrogenase maturation endopeptidase [Bacillota bacterium]